MNAPVPARLNAAFDLALPSIPLVDVAKAARRAMRWKTP
jgi:hypothetical protein